MPAITVPSDYQTGDTKIPNAISRNAGEVINGDLTDIISKNERLLLLGALGETQYNELQTALGDFDNADQKWKDLVNGSGSWIGLKSILKNYVYCAYLRFMEISVTTTGAGKAKVKNHTVTDYNQKFVERWNEIVNWNLDLWDYLENTTGLERPEVFCFYEYENQFGI